MSEKRNACNGALQIIPEGHEQQMDPVVTDDAIASSFPAIGGIEIVVATDGVVRIVVHPLGCPAALLHCFLGMLLCSVTVACIYGAWVMCLAGIVWGALAFYAGVGMPMFYFSVVTLFEAAQCCRRREILFDRRRAEYAVKHPIGTVVRVPFDDVVDVFVGVSVGARDCVGCDVYLSVRGRRRYDVVLGKCRINAYDIGLGVDRVQPLAQYIAQLLGRDPGPARQVLWYE